MWYKDFEYEIEKLVMLNTIELPTDTDAKKISSISVAHVFAEAIRRIHDNEPISKLFEDLNK